MAEYINRTAFIEGKRIWHCTNCDMRKGMKHGKMRFVYEIGDAPCRACAIDDVLCDLEDYQHIEIPDSHGDLIDRDRLIKSFCGHCDDYKKCKEPCFDLELIMNRDAVIPAEKEGEE